MATRALVLVATVAVLLVAATSCSRSESPPGAAASPTITEGSVLTRSSGSTAASTTTSTTSPTGTTQVRWSADQQAVIDDYIADRAAFSKSLENPDPDDPALPETHVDPMLTKVKNLNAEWKGFGQAGKFPPSSAARIIPRSVDIDGDHAAIETCGVDDSIVYEPATGKVLNNDVTTVLSRSELTRVDGHWKLAVRNEVQRWNGVAGCALESSS